MALVSLQSAGAEKNGRGPSKWLGLYYTIQLKNKLDLVFGFGANGKRLIGSGFSRHAVEHI